MKPLQFYWPRYDYVSTWDRVWPLGGRFDWLLYRLFWGLRGGQNGRRERQPQNYTNPEGRLPYEYE